MLLIIIIIHTYKTLFARGEQPVQKYKDELAINGDLSLFKSRLEASSCNF
jgi:hypothetical protein